jgi:hypothetical protein
MLITTTIDFRWDKTARADYISRLGNNWSFVSTLALLNRMAFWHRIILFLQLAKHPVILREQVGPLYQSHLIRVKVEN